MWFSGHLVVYANLSCFNVSNSSINSQFPDICSHPIISNSPFDHGIHPVRKNMAKNALFLINFVGLFIGLAVAEWIKQSYTGRSGWSLRIGLKNYCESFRMNVELNNIRGFEAVPRECIGYIGEYMTSIQYQVDSERAIEECLVYLSTDCILNRDGRDAWIFDIDDTLLSTIPYYKNHHFGGERLNVSSLEEWMSLSVTPALPHSLRLFNELKDTGVQIILVSSRREHLRYATVDNLINAGFYGWTSLILRSADDENEEVQIYKSKARKQLIEDGYRLWGSLGDQWSSLEGLPSARRAFKLPNPMYYIS